MEYIPDPIELMDAHIERMSDEFDGEHCMCCGKSTVDFFPMSPAPDSPAVCEECATGNCGAVDNSAQQSNGAIGN